MKRLIAQGLESKAILHGCGVWYDDERWRCDKSHNKDLDTDSGDMLQVHYKQYKLVSNYNNVKDSRL